MLKINLNLEPNQNGQFVYYPGHTLKGTVELTLNETKKVQALHVTLSGQARAHWEETRIRTRGVGRNRRTESYPVHFEGIEVYLYSRTYLIGQRVGRAFEIQPGTHKYDFSFQLTYQLAYSLNLEHGEINYYVEAALDIPWICPIDKERKVCFTVVRNDDLSIYPELKIARKYEEVRTFRGLIFESNPLLMTVSVPYTGFLIGQSVPIKIEYVNKSDIDVLWTKVKLKRIIMYTCHAPEKKTKEYIDIMLETQVAGVKKGKTNHIETFLNIPTGMLCSNGRFCQVIKISYMVEIDAEVPGDHSNPKIFFPVEIVSVPFGINNQLPRLQNSVIQPSAPIEDQFAEDLPPSFEEAMRMKNTENLPSIQQTTSNIGWNISIPSAPPNEDD